MENDILGSLTRLSDADLVGRVRVLIARECHAGAELVAHLAEMDTRDLHLRAGYASLYLYCRDALGLSEWEAYNRIEVARAARHFPVILDMLADGFGSLTAVRLLSPHLTPDNHRDLLASARGKRKLQIQEMVAALAPQADAPPSVRRVPRRHAPSAVRDGVGSDAQVVTMSSSGSGLDRRAPETGSSARTDGTPAFRCPESAGDGRSRGCALAANASTVSAVVPVRATSLTPLSPDRYKLQVTISGETLERLRLARDMLGHAVPSGDDAAVLDRALVALLTELSKKKFAATSRPRPPRITTPAAANAGTAMVRTPVARRPASAVKRAVWLRDLGRCAFVGTAGYRCNERRFVEFHHVDPYALGGEATVDGIELRCRRHNDYEGRAYFGTPRRNPCDSPVTASSSGGPGRMEDAALATPEPVPEQVRSSDPRSIA